MAGIKTMKFTRTTDYSYQWEDWHKDITVKSKHFNLYHFRIGNTVYFQDSPKFREALSKEMMWKELAR